MCQQGDKIWETCVKYNTNCDFLSQILMGVSDPKFREDPRWDMAMLQHVFHRIGMISIYWGQQKTNQPVAFLEEEFQSLPMMKILWKLVSFGPFDTFGPIWDIAGLFCAVKIFGHFYKKMSFVVSRLA